MVQTGYELVLPCCWNWLWLAQTGCWNWLWLVQTGFLLSLKLAQTGSSSFKLVFTGCECQEKMVQTGYELVLPYCWNWLWLAQTGSSWPKLFLTGYCEYQEKMVQTGSSLLLKLTVTKLVHTGSCAWQANTYLWRKMVEIGSSFLFKYNLMLTTWLAVTSSIWSSLCYTVALTSSNWFLLVVVHDKQIHIYEGSVFSTTSKELPSAFQNPSWQTRQALNMTDVKQKLIQMQKKTAEHCNKCHAVRETSPTAKSADST